MQPNKHSTKRHITSCRMRPARTCTSTASKVMNPKPLERECVSRSTTCGGVNEG